MLFTGGEDGRVCQWMDASSVPWAVAALASPPGSATRLRLALPLCVASPATSAPTTTASSFGSCAAAPISDAEDGTPGEEMARFLAGAAAVEEPAAGTAGGLGGGGGGGAAATALAAAALANNSAGGRRRRDDDQAEPDGDVAMGGGGEDGRGRKKAKMFPGGRR